MTESHARGPGARPPESEDADATSVLPEGSHRLDIEALEQSLKAAEQKAAEHYDGYVRALAELDNVRKRSSREAESAQRYAVERFAQELLPVLDGFEGAFSLAGTADPATLKAGQEATYRLLQKAVERAGIRELVPTGGAFDPEQHEAMVAKPDAGKPANTVLETIQKGYTLNGRLLRPARVVVSRVPDA